MGGATGAGWWVEAGLLLVGVAVVSFDGATPFPGVAALLPTGGALLVICASEGAAPRSTVRALRSAPAQALGRLSYSWYLHHWPLMVVAVLASQRDTTAVRLAAGTVALVVAAASLRWVERPVRTSPRWASSAGTTFALGAALTAASLLAAAALHVLGERRQADEPYASWEEARQSYQLAGCDEVRSPSGTPSCVGGDTRGDTTVVLAGDSHALQWMAAVSEVAERRGVRVLLRQLGSCSGITPRPRSGAQLPDGCVAFQEETDRLVDEVGADAVVLAEASTSRDLHGSPAAWERSALAEVAGLRSRGLDVGLVRTTPDGGDPLLCLARGGSEERCTPPRERLREVERHRSAEARLRRLEPAVPFLDVVGDVCDRSGCRLRHEGEWVFAASGHLTRGFTRSQAAEVEAFLDQLLGGR